MPADVQGIAASVLKSSYNVGETVTYTCYATGLTQTRTCTSEGMWTPLSEICDGKIVKYQVKYQVKIHFQIFFETII